MLSCEKPPKDAPQENNGFRSNVTRLWKRKALAVVSVQKPTPQAMLSPLEGQWPHKEGAFSLVVYNNTPMVNAPIDNPILLHGLTMTERVRALDIAPIRTTADREEGPWVYVAHDDFPEGGWVRRSALAFMSDFYSISWDYDQYEYLKGDLYTTYFAKPNGRYIANWRAQGQGLRLKGKYYGQMMQFEDIIWAKKDEPNGFYDFFWLDLNDALHLEWRYKSQSLSNLSVNKGE